MRLELVPKTQAKLLDIEPLSEKRGQTDMVPAVAVSIRASLPTSKIAMLDPSLVNFLFKDGDKPQGQLEPTKVLTDAAKALGAFNWAGEQSGTKLNVYYGISGDMNQKLIDGVVSKVKATPKDGGWDFDFRYYTATNVDEDVIGKLGVLKNHEIDIELVPPEIVDEKDLLGDTTNRGGRRKGGRTPEQALAETAGQQE